MKPFTGSAPIFVAIGANLPGFDGRRPLATCRDAVESLRSLPGLRLVALSRWYRSAPIVTNSNTPASQPDYVNGVARLAGAVDPAWLLARLQGIEARAGRTRAAPDAARTLDLDIVAIGDLVRDAPDPILPHPRAHLRAFVLRPLADLAPDWVHPILRRTARDLLGASPEQSIDLL